MKNKGFGNLFLRGIYVICILFFCSFATGCVSAKITSSQNEENLASKQKIQLLNVVHLYGTWEEMGRQYGALLKNELQEIYDIVYKPVMQTNKELAGQFLQTACELYDGKSYNIRQFFLGAEQTSGLSLEQLKLVNAVEHNAGVTACSALAVDSRYSGDGLIYGRNYDYNVIFRKLKNDIVLAVFHPGDGSMATATIGYVGEIYCVNGINEQGIFLELNNGTPSGGNSSKNFIHGTESLFDLMFKADSIDFTTRYFNTVSHNSSFLIGVTDGKKAVCYEWDKNTVKISDNTEEDGIMAFSNYYLNPQWPFEIPSDEKSWFGITRRNNLLSLAENSKGKIDAKKMCKIMETPIADGGAMFETETVYQIVYDAQNAELFIKIVDDLTSSWTSIELSTLFMHRK